MSVLSLMNDKNISQSRSYQGPSTGFMDVIPAAFKYTRDNFNVDASQRLYKNEVAKNKDTFKRIEGVDFNPELSPIYDAKTFKAIDTSMAHGKLKREKILEEYLDSYIDMKRTEKPEIYKDLKKSDELNNNAKSVANESLLNYQREVSRAPRSVQLVGTLIGGFGASFTDPINLATLPMGAGVSQGILRAAVIEAGINAGVELASQPAVAAWQNELGQKYGLKDAAENVGMAALFGGAMTVVVKGAKPTGRMALSALGNSKAASSIVRKASKYLERFEHIRETNPLKKSVDGLKRHLDSFQEAMAKSKDGKRIMADDLPISSKEFNEIDTRSPKGSTPEVKKEYAEINKFQDMEAKLTHKQIDSREKMILAEMNDMAIQIDEATSKSGLIKTGEQPGDFTRFRENTFPKWYRKVGAKNKSDFKKIIKKGNGKRYERIRTAAIERLENGEISPIGRVDPSPEFRKASTPEIKGDSNIISTKDVPRGTEVDPNVRAKELGVTWDENQTLKAQMEVEENVSSLEYQASRREEFDRVLEADPDKPIVVDEIENPDGTTTPVVKTMREIAEELSEDENVLAQISNCGIGK